MRLCSRLPKAATAVLPLLLLLAGLAVPAAAANHTISTGAMSYIPASLTITAGDSVTWQNTSQGQHNVVADDGSFRCANGCDGDGHGGDGTPATNTWSFTLTFQKPGTVNFHCEIHQSMGMVGTITVNAATGNPGTLSFSPAGYSVAESAGSATITVQRTGGSAGAVSVRYATSNGTAVAGTNYRAAMGTLSWGDGDAATKTFAVPVLDDGVADGSHDVHLALSADAGGARLGTASALLTITDSDSQGAPPGPCVADAQTLCLGAGGRFKATVSFMSAQQSGRGTAVALASNPASGLFYFFSQDNIEMLIKVLDACAPPFNAHWVFFAATTNVQFTVTVVDTQSGKVRTYDNALNQAAVPVQDTSAFLTCP